MERDKIIPVAFSLFVTILAVLPHMQCQLGHEPLPLPLPLPPPRPLCVSQFTLVNYACAMLPYSPAPPVSPPSPPSPHHPHPPPKHPHPPPKHPPPPHHHHHDNDNDNDNNDNDNDNGNDIELEHSHGHRHRHRHHRNTPVEKNCCRWLKQVDSECVCDLLVHLPVFLSRPAHMYSVIVDGACNVTYTCNGRLKP